jgi:hypothetical protein
MSADAIGRLMGYTDEWDFLWDWGVRIMRCRYTEPGAIFLCIHIIAMIFSLPAKNIC